MPNAYTRSAVILTAFRAQNPNLNLSTTRSAFVVRASSRCRGKKNRPAFYSRAAEESVFLIYREPISLAELLCVWPAASDGTFTVLSILTSIPLFAGNSTSFPFRATT